MEPEKPQVDAAGVAAVFKVIIEKANVHVTGGSGDVAAVFAAAAIDEREALLRALGVKRDV